MQARMILVSGVLCSLLTITASPTQSAPSRLSDTHMDEITAGVFTSLDPSSTPLHTNIIYDADGNYYVRQANGLYIENGDASKIWTPLVMYYYPPAPDFNVGIAIGVLRNELTTEMRDGGFQPQLGTIVSGAPIYVIVPTMPTGGGRV